jgi:hypothetical protein
MTERRDVLITEARKKLIGMNNDPMAKMKLIDAAQRLGISYHFEDEIHASLQKLNSMVFNSENARGVCLQFWLLRQQRYNVSSGKSRTMFVNLPELY